MAFEGNITRLEIHTVGQGFYQGFNPVVAMATKTITLFLVALLVLLPGASGAAIGTLRTLSLFGGWYIYLMAAFVFFCLLLVVLPSAGRIVLGPDGAIPEHSTLAWLCMMFCAGIGVGILVFSVSEPVSHFVRNPENLGAATQLSPSEQAVSALRFVYLHWGLSAWACYAVTGLALGLACHRYNQPMTMRSALTPLFGHRLEGPLGHLIDIISLLAIIAGITTTIVLGLEQICSGLSVLTGSRFFADQAGNPPLTALLTALVVAISIAIASVVSGVERGIKWTSQFGIALAFCVLTVFVAFGGGTRVAGLLLEASADYFTQLPVLITTLYDPGASAVAAEQRAWQGEWTIFYWAWWIAFAPFVGVFLARISRGRTLREFILGAMFVPTAMCFVWFAGTGGSALLLEGDGTAGGKILAAEHAFRIYQAVDLMLAPEGALVIKAVLVFLFLVLIVASTTTAIIAIKSIGAAGSDLAETPMHSMLWAVVIAAITGAVMAVGGVASIRDVMIVGAVPFSAIMALMLVAVVMMIGAARRGGERA